MRHFLCVVFASCIPYFALSQSPGVVSDTVHCKADPKQTYALYVPRGYYPSSRPPGLVFLFEPAARGKLPVNLYKSLADKYNVVLACSNNSRNGPIQESLAAAEAVLIDVLSRFDIERKFIVISGFSGGGRTAVQMAITNPLFAGVITCGAALPSQNAVTKQNHVPFAEVIGRGDMNYQEALIADEYLQTLGKPNTLMMFNGGHQWPPPESYEDALVWHYLRFATNDTIAKANYTSRLHNAVAQADSGYLSDANRMLRQLKRDFAQGEFAARTDSLLNALSGNKKLRSELKDVMRMDDRERFMQKNVSATYVQHVAYSAPDSAFHPEYWQAFRHDCEKLMAAKERYKVLAGTRLLDFAWRMCAEQHYMYMEYDQFRQAAMAARIWSALLPDRPGPCVEAAKAFALQGRKNEMMEYLKMAKDRGLQDKAAVKGDRAFARYAADQKFQDLLR